MNHDRDAYKESGVDIDAAADFIDAIAPLARATHRPEVLGGLGGFGSLFALQTERYREPVLVASTDGVGTKLLVAEQADRHRGIGIDLVAMCVNDILVTGAEPLFFLDYFATGRLEQSVAVEVLRGIAEGCESAGCALVGGETAEMPGVYPAGRYDVAGFAVGIVERGNILDGTEVRQDDVVIGLGSNGLHANGFSLARRILFEEQQMSLQDELPELGCSVADELLKPTAIYVRPVLDVLGTFRVKAIAHVTGGGFYDNIPRVLPPGAVAEIRNASWPVHPVFTLLKDLGSLDDRELLRTFNCGIGMVLVVHPEDATAVLERLEILGQPAHAIGRIAANDGPAGVRFVD
jgi:phosphoribosylformylglycinamidine cyclo-ligase